MFLFDAGSHDTHQLTRLGGNVRSIEQFSGDGRRLLVLCAEALVGDPEAPLCIDHVPLKQDGMGPSGREVVRLGVVDLATGSYTPSVDSGADVLEARWDTSGTRLAWVQRPHGRQRHGSQLWVRTDSGQARLLGQRLHSVMPLHWSPDGTRLALAASVEEGDSLMWLHVLDVERDQATRLEIELGTPASIEWTTDGASLHVVEAAAGLQRAIHVDAGGRTRVLHGPEQEQVQELAARGDTLALISGDANGGPELWLMDPGGTAPRKVTAFNAWRGKIRPLHVERRRFEVPDGRGGQERVDGWLVLPEGKGPFPLLLNMHGGPQVPVSLAYERHVHVAPLVERGWAVLALNAVGSSTYGMEFAHRLRGHWGEMDYPQWQAAVQSLRAEGIARDRVAVMGHSYGGFLAAWALANDPSLACGVVSAGVLDIESHAGASDTGYYVTPYAMAGELPEARADYHRLSPTTHAHRIGAPVLVLQGEDDQRCPLGQAEELFTILMRHTAVPARLVRFPGGDHHVSTTGRPSHRRAYFQFLVDWLLAHTGQVRQPSASGPATHELAQPATASQERPPPAASTRAG